MKKKMLRESQKKSQKLSTMSPFVNRSRARTIRCGPEHECSASSWLSSPRPQITRVG